MTAFGGILCIIALIIWFIRDEYKYKGREQGNGCLIMIAAAVGIFVIALLFGKFILVPLDTRFTSKYSSEPAGWWMVLSRLVIPYGSAIGIVLWINYRAKHPPKD